MAKGLDAVARSSSCFLCKLGIHDDAVDGMYMLSQHGACLFNAGIICCKAVQLIEQNKACRRPSK